MAGNEQRLQQAEAENAYLQAQLAIAAAKNPPVSDIFFLCNLPDTMFTKLVLTATDQSPALFEEVCTDLGT